MFISSEPRLTKVLTQGKGELVQMARYLLAFLRGQVFRIRLDAHAPQVQAGVHIAPYVSNNLIHRLY